jgi:type II secretion system protein G
MKGQKGFTLIELIIVIAIIAILAAVAIPNYLAFRDRANISAAKESMGAIRTALEVYRTDNNQYPSSVDAATGAPLTSTNTIQAYIDDWAKVLANFTPGTFSYSGSTNDYTVTAKAKDRSQTTVTATPGGIAP